MDASTDADTGWTWQQVTLRVLVAPDWTPIGAWAWHELIDVQPEDVQVVASSIVSTAPAPEDEDDDGAPGHDGDPDNNHENKETP